MGISKTGFAQAFNVELLKGLVNGEKTGQIPAQGANRASFQPQLPPVSSNNPFGINIPKSSGYVTDPEGNRISTGQDAYLLAHIDPNERNFWIA